MSSPEVFNSHYQSLQERESDPLDRDEVVHLMGLSQQMSEYRHLLNCGVNAVALERRQVTRGELMDAGYVFLNRIGGGEKPLLNAVIPMGVQSFDIGARVLLTQEELDAVIAHQRANPEEYGTEGVEAEELRQDMLSFLREAEVEWAQFKRKYQAAFSAALELISEDPEYSADEQMVADYLEQAYMKDGASKANIGYLIQECVQGLNLAVIRGIPIGVMPTRRAALNGVGSPFLDSGFHFDVNHDVTLHPEDPTKTRRLNMAVIHLLSRGLNEMGASSNDSHDQHYISSGEYARDVFPFRPSAEKPATEITIPREALDIIAIRLLIRAHTHFNQPWEGRWGT